MQQFIEFIGNHPYLATIWLVLFFWLVFSYINTHLSPVKDIGTHDATLLINKEDAQVVDIRPAAEFKKGHILGARQLSQEQVNKSDFASLEKHKNKPIIVVCAMGMTARKAATQLLKSGFSKVSVLKGGMNAWTTAGLPVTR